MPLGAAVTGLLAFVLIGAAQATYGPSLPGLGRAFALAPGAAGLVVVAHGVGALLGVLSAVPLEGRALARRRAGIAVAALGAGAGALGAAPAWPVTLLGAFVLGLGYGALTIGLNGLFAAGFGDRGAAMVNLLNAAFGGGAIVGPLLVAALAPDGRSAFLVIAAAAALLTPFALRLDDRVPAPALATNPHRRARAVPAGFAAVLALGVGVEAATTTWGATYLVALNASTAEAATITALFYGVFTLSRLAAAPLSLRLGPAVLVVAALGLAAALLALSHLPPLAPYGLVALGGPLALIFPNAFAWLARAPSAARGGVAFALAAALLGGALGPAVVGRVVAVFGAEAIPTAVLAVDLLALAVAVPMLIRHGREREEP